MIENTTRTCQVPVEVELNGNKYKLSPLTVPDIAEFEQWIIDDKWASACRHGFGDSQEKIKTHLALLSQPITEEEYFGRTSSVNGIRKQVYFSLRKLHPNLKEKDIDALVTEDNLAYLQAIIDSLGGKGIDPFARLTILKAIMEKRVLEISAAIDKMPKPDELLLTKDVVG
jgi:hypothetical protein